MFKGEVTTPRHHYPTPDVWATVARVAQPPLSTGTVRATATAILNSTPSPGLPLSVLRLLSPNVHPYQSVAPGSFLLSPAPDIFQANG